MTEIISTDSLSTSNASPVFVPDVEALEPRHEQETISPLAPAKPAQLDESCFDRVEQMRLWAGSLVEG